MKKLTFTELQARFNKINPFGSIVKHTNNKYWVFFDARDNRTEVEKEMQEGWGIKTDTRKMYEYYATSLIQLAHKLKIDVLEYEEKLDAHRDDWMKVKYDISDLFG